MMATGRIAQQSDSSIALHIHFVLMTNYKIIVTNNGSDWNQNEHISKNDLLNRLDGHKF